VCAVLDDADGRHLSTVSSKQWSQPGCLAYSRPEHSLYHADRDGAPVTLTRFSLDKNKLNLEEQVRDLGDRCLGLAVSPQGGTVGFLSYTKGVSLLSAVDITKTLVTFPHPVRPSACTFASATSTFFVANSGGIDGYSTVNFAQTHHFPNALTVEAMAVEPDGHFLFAATPDKVLVFSLLPQNETASTNLPPPR